MRTALTERQRVVLQWVADGCPAEAMKDHTYKTTALSLQGRQLVRVSRRRGVWRAELTETGRYYLDHGSSPPSPTPSAGSRSRVDGAGSRPGGSPDEWPPATVAGVFALLERRSGILTVHSPSGEVRAAWRRMIHVIRAGHHVPDGWHLVHRGRDSGDLVLELRRGEHPATKYRPSAAHAIAVPELLTEPHPVVNQLRDEPRRLPASSVNRSRVLMIAQALCDEAERRGFQVAAGGDGAVLQVMAHGTPFAVRAREETGARWTLRLTLELAGPRPGDPLRWCDSSQRKVEDDLGTLLDELTRRAERIHRDREERERAEQAKLAAERQKAIDEQRGVVLRDQVRRWRLATSIREHLNQKDGNPDETWVAWALAYADDIDPLTNPPGMPPDTVDNADRSRSTSAPTTPRSGYEPQATPWHPNRRWYHR